jgi:hypothetical protein
MQTVIGLDIAERMRWVETAKTGMHRFGASATS